MICAKAIKDSHKCARRVIEVNTRTEEQETKERKQVEEAAQYQYGAAVELSDEEVGGPWQGFDSTQGSANENAGLASMEAEADAKHKKDDNEEVEPTTETVAKKGRSS